MSVMINAAAATRIVPASVFDIRRPHRMIERSVMTYRRSWLVLVTGFFEPLFYLLSIRIGLASLVGDVETGGVLVAYDQFVAPGLMAASAMNGAVFDSTMNVFFKIKVSKTYDAVLTTPMTAADVALGEISFAVLRGALGQAVRWGWIPTNPAARASPPKIRRRNRLASTDLTCEVSGRVIRRAPRPRRASRPARCRGARSRCPFQRCHPGPGLVRPS